MNSSQEKPRIILNTQTIPYVYVWCTVLFMLTKGLAPVSAYMLGLKCTDAQNPDLWITFHHCPLKEPVLGFHDTISILKLSTCSGLSLDFSLHIGKTCYFSLLWELWARQSFFHYFFSLNLFLRQVRSHTAIGLQQRIKMQHQRMLKSECNSKVGNAVKYLHKNTVSYTSEILSLFSAYSNGMLFVSCLPLTCGLCYKG